MPLGNEEAYNKLVEATLILAERAASNTASSYAESFASAARQVAESAAWLRYPNQPHGGSTVVVEK